MGARFTLHVAPETHDKALTDASPATANSGSSSPTGGSVLNKRLGWFKVGVDSESFQQKVAGSAEETKLTPGDKLARHLSFAPVERGQDSPPQEQLELRTRIECVLHAARHVYPANIQDAEPRFREYFVALYGAAKWGLEGNSKGENVNTEAAKNEVERIANELIDDAAGPVKTKHLMSLGGWASVLAIPFAVTYGLLKLSSTGWLASKLTLLGASPEVFGNFMVLWIGCFLGVCISYALRTTKPTLTDLTTPDTDYLRPGIRLLFAGCLTMLLVLFALAGLIDVSVGSYALTMVATNKMLAFVVGAIGGISEVALPGLISKKASDLMPAST